MLKGVLLGSVSGLALSTVLVAAASLLAPPPGPPPSRPVAAAPEAPILRDQGEAAPRMPEPLPEREVPDEVPAPAPLGDVARDAGAADGSSPDAGSAEVPAADATPGPEMAVDPDAAPDGQAAGSVPLPAASQFNRPPEDRVAVTPEAGDESRPQGVAEGLGSGVAPPEMPRAETESAAQPRAAEVAGFAGAPEASDAPTLPRRPDETAPRTFGAVGAAPEEEEAEPRVVIETDAGESPGPGPETGDAAEVEPGPPADARQDAETPGDAAVGETRDAQPGIRLVDEADIVAPPVDEAPAAEEAPVADPDPESATVMPRRLVLDSEREEETVEPLAVPTAPAGALTTQAARFDNPSNLPLLSVVLVDDPSEGLDRDSLTAFDFPVTFAIDPTRPDAAEVARAYRGAGHEVVLLADALSSGGAAQDVEVAIGAARAAVPQALGVLDTTGGDFAGDRDALSALLPALAEAGMGFVAYPDGLNTGVTRAEKAGVPAAVVYRALDQEDERATVITRYLDRATFEAAQDGAVIVVGRTTSDTVTALYSWQLTGRSDAVAVAPLSAVLTSGGR